MYKERSFHLLPPPSTSALKRQACQHPMHSLLSARLENASFSADASLLVPRVRPYMCDIRSTVRPIEDWPTQFTAVAQAYMTVLFNAFQRNCCCFRFLAPVIAHSRRALRTCRVNAHCAAPRTARACRCTHPNDRRAAWTIHPWTQHSSKCRGNRPQVSTCMGTMYSNAQARRITRTLPA